MKIKCKINHAELCTCLSFWIFANGYAVYMLYESQTVMFDHFPAEMKDLKDLGPGWIFLSRPKDVSEVEWNSWKYFILTSWPYLIIQFMISEAIYVTKVFSLKYWYILSSVIFITSHMGLKQFLLIISQPLLFIAIIFNGGKKLSIWITSVFLLIAYNLLQHQSYFWYFLNHDNMYDEEVYLIEFCMHWVELRCISFCLDYTAMLESEKALSKMDSFVDMLCYVIYTPILYTGPLILYEDFKMSFVLPRERLNSRLRRFIWNMCIFFVYTLLLDFAFHYIYFYAIQGNAKLMGVLPTIALCGGGMWMGMQFHVKYVVAYGTGAAFAQLDNMETPPTPRCVFRINVSSEMWRYFDVGVYKFLVRYIYKPSLEILRLPNVISKVLASFGTFVFIFLWHGTVRSILIWTLLNYFCIILENVCQALSKTAKYQWFKNMILRTESMETRFIALLCVPSLFLSTISSFYLFAGVRVGNLFFEHFLHPPYFDINLLQVGFALYCCCVVSIALRDLKTRTDVKKTIQYRNDIIDSVKSENTSK